MDNGLLIYLVSIIRPSLKDQMLLFLPDELLLYVAERLGHTHDIWSLIRVNRRTYSLLLPVLYRFNKEQENCSALHWAVRHGKPVLTEKLFRRYRYDVNAIYQGSTPLICAIAYGSKVVVDLLLAVRDIDVNFRISTGECALWYAAFHGHVQIVESLLQQNNIKLNQTCRKHKFTPLSVAVGNGHEMVIKSLLRTHKVKVNARNRYGRTPIFYAASQGDSRIIQMLLADDRIDLSAQDRKAFTPLIHSILKGRTAVVEMLLGHPRPYIDVRDFRDRTALWHAVGCENTHVARLLLKQGADVGIRDEDGVTPLHASIMKGNMAVTQILLKYSHVDQSAFALQGAGINTDQPPPLCLATKRGRAEIVQLLLDHGWDVNEVDAAGRTPLHLAAERGDHLVIKVLLNHPRVNLRAQDHWESTALHEAAIQGHATVVKLLLAEPKIDINITDRNGATPLWWATHHQHDCARQLLIEPKADVNNIGQVEGFRRTSLHHAVESRATPIIQLLLASTTLDPNVLDSSGWTPLGLAASQGDVDTVNRLLTRPDVQLHTGKRHEYTPLYLAAQKGHIRVVRRLLQCEHFDINRGWGIHMSPLLAAIISGHPKVAMQLLACGHRLNVNTQTHPTDSALSLSARAGYLQVVDRILQDTRTDRNGVDERGRTALWWAAYSGQTAAVKLLLADVHVRDDMVDGDGLDALRAAKSQCHFDTVNLLRAHRRSRRA